jgi:hypothetical protein
MTATIKPAASLSLFDVSVARDRSRCACCARPWGFDAERQQVVSPLRFNCEVCGASAITCDWCTCRPGGAPCVSGAHDEARIRSLEVAAHNTILLSGERPRLLWWMR